MSAALACSAAAATRLLVRPKVGDELRERDTAGDALIDDGVVQVSGGNAVAACLRLGGGEAAVEVGIVSRLCWRVICPEASESRR